MSDDATQNLLSTRLDQLLTLVQDLIAKHAETDARVARVERVLEQRLYDTRPLWEAVQAQLQELAGRVRNVESEITEMHTQISETRTHIAEMRAQMTEMRAQMTEMRVENSNGFRLVDRKIGVLGKTLIDMTADIGELQDRVEKIESHPTEG